MKRTSPEEAEKQASGQLDLFRREQQWCHQTRPRTSQVFSVNEINSALQRVFSIRSKRVTYPIHILSCRAGGDEAGKSFVGNGEDAALLNPMEQQEFNWGGLR
jgi:hypothetical protein